MGDPVRPDWSGRLRRVWRTPQEDFAALVVSAPANIRYLCGFDGSAGFLISSPGQAWLVVDGRYGVAAQSALVAGALGPVEVLTASGSLETAMAGVIGSLGPGRVAVDAEHVTLASLERWQRGSPDRTFVGTSRWVETLRLVKDDWELKTIRRACSLLSGVARDLGTWVAPGRSEREVAADIDQAMRRAGLARPAFETIVASGPNSALPHARPTDRRLTDGDLVVLDFGGVLDGYCGDLTRMAGVGQVKADARSLFEAVRAAQVAALAAVRAEALASEVDAAARRVLLSHGFGDAILHATGHGLGLEVHEAPRLGRPTATRKNGVEEPVGHDRLAAGMVCTIEPGAYVDQLGGVRLEDDVVVTAGGCEVLTDAPRDLILV